MCTVSAMFNIFLKAIIAIALDGLDMGEVIREEIMIDLRFAGDITLLSEEAAGIQILVGASRECV